jgi:hypothetical protein
VIVWQTDLGACGAGAGKIPAGIDFAVAFFAFGRKRQPRA